MDDDELRKVAETINKGDKITIGKLDIELTVTAEPIEDQTGALIVEASREHYPEQGIVTSVLFSLGHPSGGENLDIQEWEMDEKSDVVDDYQLGEQRKSNLCKLKQLSIVE